MKKLLIGCGVLVVILALLVAGGGLFIYRTAKKVGASIAAGQEEVAATDRDFPFTAPGDGKLAEGRLEVWLKVREALKAGDQRHYTALKGGGFLAGVRGMVDLMPAALQDLAAALRREKMAAREYAWINEQVGGALKSRAAAKEAKLADLVAKAEESDPALMPAGQRKGGFRMRTDRPQYAPLDSEDARPILELLLKHEPELRKVIYPAFADNIVREIARGRRSFRMGGGSGADQAERAGRGATRKATATTTTQEKSK